MSDNASNSGVPTVLRRIIDRKFEEVAERARRRSVDEMRVAIASAPPPRGFIRSLKQNIAAGHSAVIAEVKRASPSKGLIRKDFDPAAIAKSYEVGGAACLSVLTDIDFFQGADDFLVQARNACVLPVLRKDFLVDASQVYESRLLGADCILLIVAALDDEKLHELNALGHELGMDVLVEVHDEAEMARALALNSPLIGINNRDLHTFDTSLDTTRRLAALVEGHNCLLVTESGIHTAEDVALMRSSGINTFLVGEAFMRHPEPGDKLRELFFQLPA